MTALDRSTSTPVAVTSAASKRSMPMSTASTTSTLLASFTLRSLRMPSMAMRRPTVAATFRASLDGDVCRYDAVQSNRFLALAVATACVFGSIAALSQHAAATDDLGTEN